MYKIKLSEYHKIFYNEWKLNPESYKYNIVFDQTLSSNDFNVKKINRALSRFLEDYVIFNSHVYNGEEETYWVKNSKIFKLNYIDQICSYKQMYDFVSEPFDLESGPLYRFGIFRDKEFNYRLILIFHHILIDGTSFDDLITKISEYYNDGDYKFNISTKQQIGSLMHTTNIVDNHLKLHEKENKEFWNSLLENVESINLRFIEFKSTKNHSYTSKIEQIHFKFTNEISEKLVLLKSKYNISPYMYGLMIFNLLLSRYTRQSEFGVIYPVAIKEYSNLFYGAGVNSNIYIFKVNSKSTIKDLMHQFQDYINLIKSKDYKYFPINYILENIDKTISSTCFAQTNFKNKKFDFKDVQTISVNNSFNIDLVAKLLFEQDINGNGLNYRVRYDKQEIDRFILKQFIRNYQSLYINVLSDIEQGIVDKQLAIYPVIDNLEYKKILFDWNRTYKPYPENKTIHQLFEEQVLKTPDHIALGYQETFLTYKELNIRGNQLAYFIRQYSITNENNLIVIFLDRSENIVISMLAILKAGCAYVPIDINYPDSRIVYILNDTQAKLIITNRANYIFIKKIVKNNAINAEVIILDDCNFRDMICNQNTHNLPVIVGPHSLSYIIYTSGTTGKPKGVMIEHRGVLNLSLSMIKTMELKSSSRVSQFSNFVFDASVFEIFPTLLSGGGVYVLNNEVIEDTTKLINYLRNNEITHAFFPTSYYKEINKLLDKTHLKIVHIGGESIHGLKVLPKKYKLLNQYGLTETTVCATQSFIKDLNYSYIGRPIANLKTYILDENLNPLPIGAIGELYIGGVGLARGYLNLSELTTSRFLHHKFKYGEAIKLYKTGDLVRYLPDGTIEYIERADSQIKINGVRIELSEIEFKLLQIPEIKQAVVMVLTNTGSSKSLAAYYVADSPVDEKYILNYLSLYLPRFMIPNTLIYLDKMPLNISGKIDKKSLPKIDLVNKTQYYAPRNKLEKLLISIYSRILNLDKRMVGINNSFFELGGNSIKAIKLVSKVNLKLNSNIKLADIFISPEITNLALRIIHAKNKYEPIINFNNSRNKPNLFMIHPGHSGCEVYTELAYKLKDSYRCYGVNSYNLYSKEKFTNLKDLAKYYLSEIDKVMYKTGQQDYYFLGWSLGGNVAIEIAAMLESHSSKVKIKIFLLDTIIPDKIISEYRTVDFINFEKQLIKADMQSRDYSNSYIDTIISNIDINYQLLNSSNSAKIMHTNIILFKAAEPTTTKFLNYKLMELGNYITKLPFNNVDLIHQDLTKVAVLRLAEVNHNNILEYLNKNAHLIC